MNHNDQNYEHLIVAAERERCAKICEQRAQRCEAMARDADDQDDVSELRSLAWQFNELARAIRTAPPHSDSSLPPAQPSPCSASRDL